MNTLENSAHLKTVPTLKRRISPYAMAVLVPLGLAVLILLKSPNFQTFDTVRMSPYGGDFLQEWIGGHLIASGDASRLYDTAYFTHLQHDAELVGFHWDEDDYYPPVYSPGYYFLVSPLSWLPYQRAAQVWLLFSLGCLFLTFALFIRFHPTGERMGIWIPLASAFFTPLLFSLNIGHKSILLLLIFTSTYLLIYHKRWFAAGICFGLVAFKPHFILAVAIWMLAKRQWRFLAGLATCGGAWIGLCVLVSPQLLMDYLSALTATSDYLSTSGYQLEMAHGIWSGAKLSLNAWAPAVSSVCALAGVISVVLWVLWNSRGELDVQSTRFANLYSCLILLTVLVSPHFYHYDLTILILPIALSLGCNDLKASTWGKILAGLLLALFVCAGLFQPIAHTISVQLSLAFLLAWMYLLMRLNIQSKAASSLHCSSRALA